MTDKIGNVRLDYSVYTGQDYYSDGHIENEILDQLKKGKNPAELMAADYRWPLLYHFSPERRNLLEWYNFKPKSSLLEVGAGCGALTGLFSEKNEQVTAVELSKVRAEIIAHRHHNLDNLEIRIGNLNEMSFHKKYDYLTLIGVFEYAAAFTAGPDPYNKFLTASAALLNENGVLMIAIENKFGLKYWSGAKEDHTGLYFEGIEGYRSQSTVSTFGKHELEDMLFAAGYKNITFYYPYPDYKLPSSIYSDQHLPGIGDLFNPPPNYDHDRIKLFDEALVFDNLIHNRLFQLFSNSFLILAQKR